MRAALLSLVLVLTAAACTPADPPTGPALRVSWAAAAGPRAGLPPDVDGLTVRILDPDGDPAEREQEITRDEITDDTPYAVVGGLPVGRAVEVRIEARVGARVAYSGVVGPVVLGPGERRYVDLLLVPTDAVTEIGRIGEPIAMQTATRLVDGRILFTGGFTTASGVACTGQPNGSRCFDLTASAGGVLYDPASGRIMATRNSMTTPRAAHTATLLADGRVLVAGGVTAAQLALVAQDDGGLLPVLRVDDGAALSSTEIFDPAQFGEDDDVGADGDAGGGGFEEGPAMASGRAQHTATTLPSSDAVLVAGGSGGAETTSELFRGGAWTDAGALAIARRSHVAIAVVDTPSVWLAGGAIGADAEPDVAEVFSVDAGGAGGTWGPAPDLELPDASPDAAASLNLVGAGIALLVDRVAVVFGWIGPVCDAGGAPAWTGTVCPPDDRSFALDLRAARVAQPLGPAGELHAMGAVIPAPDGGVFAIGGFSSLAPAASAAVERLTGEVDLASLEVEVDAAVSLTLGEARAFLAGAAQTDGTAVVAGGLSIDAGGVVISDRLELVNPPR
jgi:hypothetical protein